MESVYILMICAAGVFFILVLAYIVYAREKAKTDRLNAQALDEAYSDKNLTKMEYDFAFYDDETYNLLYGKQPGQVTIDEVLGRNNRDASAEASAQKVEETLFAKIDAEGVEEITGKFNG